MQSKFGWHKGLIPILLTPEKRTVSKFTVNTRDWNRPHQQPEPFSGEARKTLKEPPDST
jgi:hypothetical protein